MNAHPPLPDLTTPPAVVGRHGFIAYPGHVEESQSSWAHRTSFSIGVFAWQSKAGGQGVKPGPVKVRVKGFFNDAQAVYDKARELCVRLDAGEAMSQKNFTV